MIREPSQDELQQVARLDRRPAQLHRFRRNRICGVLLIAAAILISWLLRTNPRWIFPPGWWRP
jgi:hypothetical protein